jgi:hypothetical protein
MVLPRSEVADVPLTADRCGPGFTRLLNCFVTTNREQNNPFSLDFPVRSMTKLSSRTQSLNARRGSRIFSREGDRLVDALAEPITDLERYLWR